MTMRSARYSGLYYPQDPHTLREQVRPVPAAPGPGPKAVLLPHAAWPYVLPLLHQGLAHTRTLQSDLIVLLAPDHGAKKNSLPTTSGRPGLCLPHQDVPFASDLAAALAQRLALQVDDRLLDDESSWELLVPLLASYHPEAKILPILAGELTGSHKHHLASLLGEIRGAFPSALFVITANANLPLPSPAAEECARRTASFLEMGGQQGQGCNRSALQVLGAVLGGRWRIIAQMSRGTAYDEIPPSLDESEAHVWHIGALLE